MYRNIAFDLGGVVVDFAPHDFLLENFCSAPIEQKVYDITFGSKEWQQLDAGLITRAQGDAIMLEMRWISSVTRNSGRYLRGALPPAM